MITVIKEAIVKTAMYKSNEYISKYENLKGIQIIS